MSQGPDTRRAYGLYLVGVAVLACAGFFSPLWFLGFLPAGVGLVWAAYDFDLVEVTDGEPSSAPQR